MSGELLPDRLSSRRTNRSRSTASCRSRSSLASVRCALTATTRP